MGIRVYAVIPEMENAANRLDTHVSEFRTATEATRSAAETVAAGWEGDSKEAFAAEQKEAISFYELMSSLMTEYSGKIRLAAKTYTDTDAQCAKILRSV